MQIYLDMKVLELILGICDLPVELVVHGRIHLLLRLAELLVHKLHAGIIIWGSLLV